MMADDIQSVGSSMSSAFEDLEPFALEGTRSSFFLGTERSNNEDAFLSNLLQEREKKKKLSLRNVAQSVMALSHRSFRKSSKSAFLDETTTEAPPKLASTRKLSEVPAIDDVDFESDEARSQRLVTEVMQWISSPAGENLNRVKLIKRLLEGCDSICNDFLKDHRPAKPVRKPVSEDESWMEDDDLGDISPDSHAEPREQPPLLGLGSLLMSRFDDFRAMPNADTKLSQGFDILMAAAVSCHEVPTPLPQSIVKALETCLYEWRPPLSSFFSLKFIIALSPTEALPFCKHVMLQCVHYSFRITETALVCVAEESLEGTLPDPATWVQPVLSVLRLLATTKISAEMITLALDVMSFTFSCGGAGTFLSSNGFEVFEEVFNVASCEEMQADVVRRMVKLLNPTTLDIEPTDAEVDASAVDPLSNGIGKELTAFGFPESPSHSEDRRNQPDDVDGAPVPSPRSSNNNEPIITLVSPKRRKNVVTTDVLQALLRCVTLVLSKFVTSANDGGVLDECAMVVYGMIGVNVDVCVKDRVVSLLCQSFVTLPSLWTRDSTVRALLATIQTYLVARNRANKAGPLDALADGVLGDARVIKEIATNSNNIAYYRCIMDDPSVLATCSVAVTAFAHSSPQNCPPLAAVLKALYIMAHADPARSHLLGAKLRAAPGTTQGKAPHLLIPILIGIVGDKKAAALHRYAYSILHRLCKGPQRFACGLLIEWQCGGVDDSDTRAVATETFLEALGNRIVVERLELVHSMIVLGAELARYCTLSTISVPVTVLQHFFGSILTAQQNYAHEPYITALTCVIMGHLSRYGSGSSNAPVPPLFQTGSVASTAPTEPTAMLNFAIESGVLDTALQLSKDPRQPTAAIGYLLAALSLHPSAAAAIVEEGAMSAIEAATKARDEGAAASPNASSKSMGGAAAANAGKAQDVLTREDRSFCRQQLARLSGGSGRDDFLRSPGITHLSPTFSGTFMMPALPQGTHTQALAHSQHHRRFSAFSPLGGVDSEVSQLIEQQKGQLLSDFNAVLRDVSDTEREARGFLLKQFEEKLQLLNDALRKHREDLRSQRQALEKAEADARRVVEDFAEDDFLSVMTYSQRSLQKKVTAMHKRMTRMGSAMLLGSAGGTPRTPHTMAVMDEYIFGSRRESLADNFQLEVVPPPHSDVPDDDRDDGVGTPPPPVQIMAPGDDHPAPVRPLSVGKRFSQYTRGGEGDAGGMPTALRRSTRHAPSVSSQPDSGVMQTMLEVVTSLQQTVAEMQRDHAAQMTQLLEMTRSAALTPAPPGYQVTGGEAAAMSRPTSARPASRSPPLDPASRYFTDDAELQAAIDRRTQYLCRRPQSAGSAGLGRRSPNTAVLTTGSPRIPVQPSPPPTPPPGGRLTRVASPHFVRSPLVTNAKVTELLHCIATQANTITSLDLSRHYLGDAGLIEVLPALVNCTGLRFLSLRQNGITAVAVPSLIEVLQENQLELESLDLSQNKGITPRVGRNLVTLARAAPHLVSINLEGTQIFASTRAIIAQTLFNRQMAQAAAAAAAPPVAARGLPDNADQQQ